MDFHIYALLIRRAKKVQIRFEVGWAKVLKNSITIHWL